MSVVVLDEQYRHDKPLGGALRVGLATGVELGSLDTARSCILVVFHSVIHCEVMLQMMATS